MKKSTFQEDLARTVLKLILVCYLQKVSEYIILMTWWYLWASLLLVHVFYPSWLDPYSSAAINSFYIFMLMKCCMQQLSNYKTFELLHVTNYVFTTTYLNNQSMFFLIYTQKISESKSWNRNSSITPNWTTASHLLT